MRPIHLARLDKTRPAVVLTRELARPYLTKVTIAPITSRIRGIMSEVPVGSANGLDHDSIISVDNITTIPAADLGRQLGFLLPEQDLSLTEAIRAAFDLV